MPHKASPCVLTEVASNKSFGSSQKVYSHYSEELGCQMNFGVYFPPQYEEAPLPVVYWLSGLTCSEKNFIEKAGAQRYAAEHGVILVNPDTSPRGLNLPGDSESWDFGVGAGFYINAEQKPWSDHYKMFNYVTIELMAVVKSNFKTNNKQSIMGHSMGGHGALICALKNPGLYASVSAFAPISNPINCPWGEKAFSGYLGSKETGNWQNWDATELVKNYNGPHLEVLIDQGKSDDFYVKKQLLPENFVAACGDSGTVSTILNLRDGYDHSYYFIASFIGDHIKHHATALKSSE